MGQCRSNEIKKDRKSRQRTSSKKYPVSLRKNRSTSKEERVTSKDNPATASTEEIDNATSKKVDRIY